MNKRTTCDRRAARYSLAVSLACAVVAPASAVDFNIGEFEGQFDSSLSVGASWSTQQADQNLIGFNNGGRGVSQRSDDGRLNFDRGDTFSKRFKGIHDLDLRYGSTGVFLRGTYWYDFELKDESRPFKAISDHNRKQRAQSSGAEILDAFIYHNYALGQQPGSVRLGKQVVSWGQSTFIANGINAINPLDVAAFRSPGVELNDGLIPINMLFVSQKLTDNLSAQAFYQLEWDQSVADNCGTFFSQSDSMADGCDGNLRMLQSSSRLTAAAQAGLSLYGVDVNQEGVRLPRGADRDARDSGQWGLSLRYMFEPLATEFGLYAMNYHSRAPILSTQAGSEAAFTTIDNFIAAAPAARASLAQLMAVGAGQYFLEYPEDIRLYGVSFNTALPTGTAWSGEISYRPNAPVQLNSTDILNANLIPLTAMPLTGGIYAGSGVQNVSRFGSGYGETATGYKRKEITQFQTALTHSFDQIMGASRLTLVGEVAVAHVGGLEDTDELRYGRADAFGPGPLRGNYAVSGVGVFPTCTALNVGALGNNPGAKNVSKYCEDDGFVTATSWGYRMRATWDYPNVFAGVSLRPSVAWSHDVDGYGPNGLFTEDAKAVSLGLSADYRKTYSADLSYTSFFGGRYNTAVDRDFVALNVGVNF